MQQNENREKTINVGGGVVQYLHSGNYFSRTRIELAIFAKYRRLENNPLYGIAQKHLQCEISIGLAGESTVHNDLYRSKCNLD